MLGRLVDKGNTVIVIEHNLDVIKTADWVIDMGPEGGTGGGTVVATGTPEEVAAVPDSHTGRFLRHCPRPAPDREVGARKKAPAASRGRRCPPDRPIHGLEEHGRSPAAGGPGGAAKVPGRPGRPAAHDPRTAAHGGCGTGVGRVGAS